MTAQELKDKFDREFGLSKNWPSCYTVDAETYGYCCQAIFDSRANIHMEGYRLSIWVGPSNGLMFKNIELILENK